jgi:hypothetical protein
MGIGRFRIGQRVMDDWQPCYFHAKAYANYSVGIVLDVIEQETKRWHYVTDPATKNYVKQPVAIREIKYRIRWTNGPKAGKITYMKNLFSYDDKIDHRRTTLSGWNQAFDDFYTTTSKESR